MHTEQIYLSNRHFHPQRVDLFFVFVSSVVDLLIFWVDSNWQSLAIKFNHATKTVLILFHYSRLCSITEEDFAHEAMLLKCEVVVHNRLAPGSAPTAASGGDAPAATEDKKEEKKAESEESGSDDDMGFGLFD